MTYNEAVEYINSMLRFGSKLGLERIENLLEKLGNPHKKLKYIHVAGTNGKGSICAYASSIFKAAGYKTGMFISPYVIDFRERFQINGEMIPKNELAELTSRLKSVVDTLGEDELPTEFEFITALAFMYFEQNKCDIVVLEVGLGGMYDSTNVIDTPVCSVIGPIGLDHTAILGDTVDKIAEQKAGIIKPNGKTVCYPVQPDGAMRVIKSVSERCGSRLIIPDVLSVSVKSRSISGDEVSYKNLTFRLPILGKYQPYNAATAVEAAKSADGFDISDEAVVKGLSAAYMPARCEVINPERPILLDGAHNPDGAAALADIVKTYGISNISAVMGMMADKDVDSVMSILAPLFKRIYTVTVNNPRSMSAKELADCAAKYCGNVKAEHTVEAAVKSALSDGGAVCICGSFYLAGEVYGLL